MQPETSFARRAASPGLNSSIANPQSSSRYVVERCAGGAGRAVYEVLDMTRHVTRRVVCRTNFADANMIRDALEMIAALAEFKNRPFRDLNSLLSITNLPLPPILQWDSTTHRWRAACD